ncbi:MAG: hypothetical protein ACK51N_00405 [bacterium]|jgi:hypothetical protein|nr:hypothetical protein [Phycisphaerales bacterium]MCE2654393.1 hypothetical protein [Planctomycetaceae bacterium]
MKATSLLTIAGSLLLMAVPGCTTSSQQSSVEPSTSRVGFTLEASTTELVIGETATVYARSSDTFGRNPEIAWATTMGRLTVEQNGRIARITFDQAGTAAVTAVLSVDGREIRRASVQIRVKPLS